MRVTLSTLIPLLIWMTLMETPAQSLKEVPPPTPPFVAKVPENVDWIVAPKNPLPPIPPPAVPDGIVRADRRVLKVHTTKTGKTKRDLISTADGKTTERWYVDSYYFWTPPGEEVSVSDFGGIESNPLNVDPAPPFGFPGVGWVKLENYDKAELFDKIPCYHYTTEGIEAWIDIQTRLPVAYKSGADFYQFKFNAPPDRPLTLPPAYEKVWKAVQDLLERRK